MPYLIVVFLILVSINTFDYAAQAWNQGNRVGAVGVGLLALAATVFPGWVLFFL